MIEAVIDVQGSTLRTIQGVLRGLLEQGGIDALLSTVQMPPGVPVATMGIGKAGAKNAAVFAVKILALNNEYLYKKLIKFRNKQKKRVLERDIALKKATQI